MTVSPLVRGLTAARLEIAQASWFSKPLRDKEFRKTPAFSKA